MSVEGLIRVIEDQHEIVLKLESPTLTKHAADLAYYHAMYMAALDDPLDDPNEQTAILSYLEENIAQSTASYMSTVNEMM